MPLEKLSVYDGTSIVSVPSPFNETNNIPQEVVTSRSNKSGKPESEAVMLASCQLAVGGSTEEREYPPVCFHHQNARI